MSPGETQLTRMPWGASSLASAHDSDTTAPLAAAYGAAATPPPVHEARELRFTIDPDLRCIIAGAAAWQQKSVLVTLASITRRHKSGVISSRGRRSMRSPGERRQRHR